MKFSDFQGFSKKTIVVVDSVKNPYGDYYIIKLKIDSNMKWIPGEHGIFKMPDNKVEGKKWRAFSVASISEEGYMMIGTHSGDKISSFKNNLINMKKGEKISVNGPFGWFKLQDDTSPLVFVANGVGITPVRSILKSLENNETRDVKVIYASKDYYLFGKDIENIALNNPRIMLFKTSSREETKKKIDEIVKLYKNKAFYYISGSSKAIKSIKKQVKSYGIKGNKIINDPFLGY